VFIDCITYYAQCDSRVLDVGRKDL